MWEPQQRSLSTLPNSCLQASCWLLNPCSQRPSHMHRTKMHWETCEHSLTKARTVGSCGGPLHARCIAARENAQVWARTFHRTLFWRMSGANPVSEVQKWLSQKKNGKTAGVQNQSVSVTNAIRGCSETICSQLCACAPYLVECT